MAIDTDTLKLHLNITDDADDTVITQYLNAAQTHLERQLGFALDDADEFPDGTPADVDQAVLMLAAHWYENREATLVGVTAQSLPMGVADIVGNYRTYSFGSTDDA